MFSDDVLKRILAVWPSVSRRRNDAEMLRSPPLEEDLAELLRVAFLAGIEREEGESISFRLVYYPRMNGQSLAQVWPDSVPFSEPVPLTVGKVVKLSPAFDQSLGALAVSRDQQRQWKILGAIFYRPRRTSLDGIETDTTNKPRALTLSVRQPGSVILSFGDHIVGRFERGSFLPSKADPIFSTRLSGVFLDRISQHQLHRRFSTAYRNLYLHCLCRLYQSAGRHGHGSTLLWFPNSLRAKLLDHLEAGTEVVSTPNILEVMRLKLERQRAEFEARTGPGQIELQQLSERLSGLLDSMGRLSCIDGALVFNELLEIERFGCVLSVPPWDGRTLDGGSLDPNVDLSTSIFGTRHRSAIALVGAVPGTVAFVVSEDGPVRILTRFQGENAVVLWPDCRDTVFLD